MSNNNSKRNAVDFQEIEESIKRCDIVEKYIYKKLTPNKYEEYDINIDLANEKILILLAELIPQWD